MGSHSKVVIAVHQMTMGVRPCQLLNPSILDHFYPAFVLNALFGIFDVSSSIGARDSEVDPLNQKITPSMFRLVLSTIRPRVFLLVFSFTCFSHRLPYLSEGLLVSSFASRVLSVIILLPIQGSRPACV